VATGPYNAFRNPLSVNKSRPIIRFEALNTGIKNESGL